MYLPDCSYTIPDPRCFYITVDIHIPDPRCIYLTVGIHRPNPTFIYQTVGIHIPWILDVFTRL